MIKLLDVLSINEKDYKKYKVHFAIGSKDPFEPKLAFLNGNFNYWQSIQNNKNFERPYVISLIYLGNSKWLFAGVFKVNGKPHNIFENNKDRLMYDLELLDIQKDLIGRIIVHYQKSFRNAYPTLELKPKGGIEVANMEIYSINEDKLKIEDFPGFDNVLISYKTLKTIFEKNIPSWKDALSNVKGVYLIVDNKSGKMYVGSAYGEDCIWSRWKTYATNGHGGNKKLKELLTKYGEDYKNNFSYSVLEVSNLNLGNDYIILRESHWKDVLMTRKFGLNEN